jgi:hypothetical protein
VIVYLGDKDRVIDCKDSIQWIIQRLFGQQWHGYSFHRDRNVLIEAQQSYRRSLEGPYGSTGDASMNDTPFGVLGALYEVHRVRGPLGHFTCLLFLPYLIDLTSEFTAENFLTFPKWLSRIDIGQGSLRCAPNLSRHGDEEPRRTLTTSKRQTTGSHKTSLGLHRIPLSCSPVLKNQDLQALSIECHGDGSPSRFVLL